MKYVDVRTNYGKYVTTQEFNKLMLHNIKTSNSSEWKLIS